MEHTFMKERAILPLVLTMSLPMVLSMLVSSLYNIVDSYFVAQISEDAMTALSLVFPMQNLINAVISYYLGAQDGEKANIAATQGLALSAVHGVILTVGCIAVMPAFLGMFTDDQLVISLGLRYSNIAFAFSVIIALGMCFEKIFQSLGKMTLTMVCVLSGCIANIILDPVLIFGLGPFPELGIEGAALATGIGQTLSLAVYLIACLIRPLPLRISPRYLSFRGTLAGRLYAIGVPATLNLALPSLLVSALNIILAAFSQTYVVILGIYYKLQTFLYLPANDIVQGIRPLVGYNYGAGQYSRVRRSIRFSVAVTVAYAAAFWAVAMLFPGMLIRVFNNEPEVVEAGIPALRIYFCLFIPMSLQMAGQGVFVGLGRSKQAIFFSLLRKAVINAPLTVILPIWIGTTGVFTAEAVSQPIGGLACILTMYFTVYRPLGSLPDQPLERV